MKNYREHWDEAYSKSEITKLGWYEANPLPSLDLIKKCNFSKDASIIDIGSGTTKLIENLRQDCFRNIYTVDISELALNIANNNLRADNKKLVNWIVDDITNPKHLDQIGTVDLWHDRTVLHFLTEKSQRIGYLETLKRLVKKEGYVIIAVFSLDGAKKCSGLDVINYDHKMISEFLGNEFRLIEHFPYLYTMPSGDTRPYIYTLFQRLNWK